MQFAIITCHNLMDNFVDMGSIYFHIEQNLTV